MKTCIALLFALLTGCQQERPTNREIFLAATVLAGQTPAKQTDPMLEIKEDVACIRAVMDARNQRDSCYSDMTRFSNKLEGIDRKTRLLVEANKKKDRRIAQLEAQLAAKAPPERVDHITIRSDWSIKPAVPDTKGTK